MLIMKSKHITKVVRIIPGINVNWAYFDKPNQPIQANLARADHKTSQTRPIRTDKTWSLQLRYN